MKQYLDLLRHVLEHIQDPVSFLAEIANANQGGQIYIEVPCFDWILEHKAWFDLFYEHVNYFRLDDLRRMFGTVHEAGHLFGGQYLYVVADLASLRDPGDAGLPAPEPATLNPVEQAALPRTTLPYEDPGFFGIGGGFLIVPALVASTAMPIYRAIGTSLIAVAAFGLGCGGSGVFLRTFGGWGGCHK